MDAEQGGVAARLRGWLGLAPPFDTLALGWAIWTLGLASALSSASLIGFRGTQAHFLVTQDLPAFVVAAALTVALGRMPARWRERLSPGWLPNGPAAPLMLAAVCSLAGCIGFRLVFDGYLQSLDEFLADFDARIFAHGRLMAPVAAAWRPFVPALQPIYMLPNPNGDVWASAYLPVHAALRAVARSAGATWALNPLLSAFSVVSPGKCSWIASTQRSQRARSPAFLNARARSPRRYAARAWAFERSCS